LRCRDRLGVVGNISRDRAAYPDGRRYDFVGGAALHITLAAARAGQCAAPIAVIGNDLAWILRAPELAALDLRQVAVADGPSCSFTMTYDQAGDLQAVDCHYGVATRLTKHAAGVLSRADYAHLHVCCRRPLDVALILAGLVDREAAFSVDFYSPSAPALLPAAAPALPHAHIVFVNAAEYQHLAAITDPAALRMIVVTDGPRPVRLLTGGRPIVQIRPPPGPVVEATGAGDTLAGCFLAAYLIGLDHATALRHAVEAATASLTGPIYPDHSKPT
jgi:sugar/nucleoside kinase (ribokinase family)